jgi:hypothetical protein
MAHYFSYLPNTQYKINGIYCCRRQETVTDITKRFRIAQLLNGRESVYYTYNVQDGDRPDIIARKMYGDERLDWIILLTNELHDRYYEFPLSQSEFEEFIKTQYGSLGAAQALIHHYEQILQPQTTLSNGTVIPERRVIVDETTYNSLPLSDRREVTAYQQEERNNEARRQIKILDPNFVNEVLIRARRLYQ